MRRLQIKLNHNKSNQLLVFGERGKSGYPGEKLLEQSREATNSVRIGRWDRILNPATLVEGGCSHHCAKNALWEFAWVFSAGPKEFYVTTYFKNWVNGLSFLPTNGTFSSVRLGRIDLPQNRWSTGWVERSMVAYATLVPQDLKMKNKMAASDYLAHWINLHFEETSNINTPISTIIVFFSTLSGQLHLFVMIVTLNASTLFFSVFCQKVPWSIYYRGGLDVSAITARWSNPLHLRMTWWIWIHLHRDL